MKPSFIQNLKNFKNEFLFRFHSVTPTWFRKIRNLSIHVTGLAVSLIGASAVIPGFILPDAIQKICTYLVVAGISAGMVSTTAKV